MTTSTTDTKNIDEDAALTRAALAGPGHQRDKAELERKAAEQARIVYEATGGDEGAERREAQATQAEQELIDGTKRSAARVSSLRQAVAAAPTWSDESAALEATIADPDATPGEVVDRFVELCQVVETADRIHAYGNQAIAGELGATQGRLRELSPRESVASVLDRYIAARVDSVVSGKVNAMLADASEAYHSAVK